MPTALGIVASHRTAPAGFNPLSIPWHSAFWASDPAWIPPADGAGVSSWRNAGTCAVNATQATAGQQPIYRASYANLNGKPALELTAPARQWMATTTPLITQPNHIVSIGWLAAPGVSDGEATICDSHTGSRHLFRNRPDGLVEMYAGGLATVSGAGRHSVPYLMLALFNGASSKLRTNGTNYTVGDVGSGGFSNMNLFTYNGSSANCPVGGMAFLGVKDSELTAQEITDLETWASTYYGVPLPSIPMTGLVGWYDADDASTFAYQGGVNVLTWQDKSTNAKHMTAQFANPTRDGTQNGRPTVKFNGTARMSAAAPLSTAVDNVTMFVACKRTGGDANASVVFHVGDPAANGYGIALRANGANVGFLRGALAWHATTFPDPAAASAIVLQRSSGTWSMWLNGGALSLSANQAPNVPAAATWFVSGEHLWAGEIYEAISYNRVLSTVERQQVESYLTTKWGIAMPTACTNVLAEPFNNLTAWTLTGTPTIVAGRTGTAASFNGTTNAATYTIPPASESDRLTIGFAFKVSSLAATRTLMDLLSDSGATVHNRIQLSTIGQVIVNRGTGSAIGSTVSGVVVVNTWYYLEVQILLSDAFPSGSLIARLDGAQIFSAAPGDSKNGGTKTVYDQIRLGPSGSAANTYLVDDLYLSTGPDCTFQGDHTIP